MNATKEIFDKHLAHLKAQAEAAQPTLHRGNGNDGGILIIRLARFFNHVEGA